MTFFLVMSAALMVFAFGWVCGIAYGAYREREVWYERIKSAERRARQGL